MDGPFSETHEVLRAVARDVLGARPAGSGVDWPVMAACGWLGLETADAFEGAGATFAEVAVVLEEMGRAAARSPYLGSVVLGAGALARLEPSPGRDELLRAAASGAVVLAVGLGGDEDDVPGGLPFRVERAPGHAGVHRVHGQAGFVPDAADAGRLLLPARDADDRPVMVVVEPQAAGLGVTAQPVLDATRRLAVVTATGVEIDESAVWGFATDPEACVRRLRDRAAVAVACDSLGLSEGMLDATVAYVAVRQQFGRAIGSFQAVKHACADMLVKIAVARELVAAAVEHLAAADPEASVTAARAKSYACAVAVDVVGKAMQLHGGIGYTWESGVHVYLKRAALNRSLFGSPAAHRRHLATRYA
jgi:alkylation response protein AidB-like acyl-CoA dehydrogenase